MIEIAAEKVMFFNPSSYNWQVIEKITDSVLHSLSQTHTTQLELGLPLGNLSFYF